MPEPKEFAGWLIAIGVLYAIYAYDNNLGQSDPNQNSSSLPVSNTSDPGNTYSNALNQTVTNPLGTLGSIVGLN